MTCDERDLTRYYTPLINPLEPGHLINTISPLSVRISDLPSEEQNQIIESVTLDDISDSTLSTTGPFGNAETIATVPADDSTAVNTAVTTDTAALGNTLLSDGEYRATPPPAQEDVHVESDRETVRRILKLLDIDLDALIEQAEKQINNPIPEKDRFEMLDVG